MADPLRRTLLAKLRGKKSKKGATVGGGYSSTTTAAGTAAANGGREGNEKVLQTQRDFSEARPVVVLTGFECTSERMSTYENCVDGAMVQSGGVVLVRQSRATELAGTRPQERCGGGRVRVNEQLLGVSLQRAVQFGGHAVREGHRSHQGPRSADKLLLSAGLTLEGPHVRRKHVVSGQRQCSFGDSIGFGDNPSQVLYRTRVESHIGAGKPTEGRVPTVVSEVTESRHGGNSRHMAATVVAVDERNDNLSFDKNQTLETVWSVCTAHLSPNCASRHSEENILIRNVESYGPESAGEIRGSIATQQSPTFFPTELEICESNMESLFATEESLRYTLESEDEDYYDNEILPFYETIRVKSDRADVAELRQSGQDKGQLDDSNSAQETDRLRNQLKEAYYLLINAMNDINMDVQQISGGLIEQHATSSCSSHSRDSLCSRLSAKNMDSDSWSSGGDNSAQQVSDTDSLLLCLSGNPESGLKGCGLNSKSMVNLSWTKKRPKLLRSASDGDIRYLGGLCFQVTGVQSPVCEGTGINNAKVTGGRELPELPVLYDAISSDELLQDAADEDRGSGSVNSLTGSSDSNADPSAHRGQDHKREPTGVQSESSNPANKGHGVTVNKMQQWMHKGRLLSSEMKQRIEGSPLPRGGPQSRDRSFSQANPNGCKTGVQTASPGVKSVKAKSPTIKSPRQQQPGRKATRSGLNSCGPSKSETSHPPSSRLIIVILLHS